MKNTLIVLSLLSFGLLVMLACVSSAAIENSYVLSPTLMPWLATNNVSVTPGLEATPPSEITSTVTLVGESSWFSPEWQWFKGASECNCHNFLSENHYVLTLIAGPQTRHWDKVYTAPRLERRMESRSTVQVHLDFDPEEDEQIAGIGLRAGNDQGTWIAVRRYAEGKQHLLALSQSRHGQSETLVEIPFARSSVFVKINRIDERLTFAVSENGINWVILKSEHVFVFHDEVNVFLYVSSAGNHETLAKFDSFSMVEAPWQAFFQCVNSNVSFGNGTNLALPWSWYPGGAKDNDFTANYAELQLVAGPYTTWNHVYSAPRVEYPIRGDFQIEARIYFTPTVAEEVAGLYVRPAENWDSWIAIRREYDVSQGPILSAVRNKDGETEVFFKHPYAQPQVHVRIRRERSLLRLEYSLDGISWSTLHDEFVMDLSPNVWAALSVYSNTKFGTLAHFSEVKIVCPLQ